MTKWPARVRDSLREVNRRFAAAVVFALAVAFLSDAAAQDGPLAPLGVRLSAFLGRDSNVFRVPDDAPDPQQLRGISGKSDTFRTTVLGLDVDKTYSRQRFTASITKTETRYNKFTSLDRDLLDYNGKLQWEVGPRVRGVLFADHTESVIEFEDQQACDPLILALNPALCPAALRVVNKRTTDRRDATIVIEVTPRWHLLGGLSEYSARTSQLFLAQPSTDIDSQELGLRYVSGSLNSVTLMRRSKKGQYILPSGIINVFALIDTDFTDTETELQATWQPTGNSTLNGRLTWLERENQHLPQRDFSGTAGELRYLWTPTGKLSFGLTASRNILPWTADTQASYRVDDLIIFRPVWQVSDKIRLSLNPSRLVSDFRGPVAPLTGPLRNDKLYAVTFAAEWTPYQGILVVGTLQHSQRKSTNPGLEFKDTIATLNASLRF